MDKRGVSAHGAFFDVTMRREVSAADRTEFIGPQRNATESYCMSSSRLSGRVGAALDPCAVIQVPSNWPMGKNARSLSGLDGSKRDDVREVVQRFEDLLQRAARSSRHELLEAHPRRGKCGNARSIHQFVGQRLAGLSNMLPTVGTERVLPIIGCLSVFAIKRGRDGARSYRGLALCVRICSSVHPVSSRKACPAIGGIPDGQGCSYPLLG